MARYLIFSVLYIEYANITSMSMKESSRVARERFLEYVIARILPLLLPLKPIMNKL